MTKDLFTSNIKSVSVFRFLTAVIVAVGYVMITDFVVYPLLFSGKIPPFPVEVFLPGILGFLQSLLFAGLFYIVLRGFIGHLKPMDAFRKVFIFFAVLNILFMLLGVSAGEEKLLFGSVTSILDALGNALAAYILATGTRKAV